MAQIMTREQAAALIQDGDTVVITGSGGGVMEAYPTPLRESRDAF